MPEVPTNPATAETLAAAAFITRWRGVTASELSTAQSFVIDLCALLAVDKPHPTPEQDYMFERPVTFRHGDGSTSPGRIDCYRRGAFCLESKKLKAAGHTKGFDDGLLRARSQAEGYARALPASEGRPPFVLVVDVGTVIEVYAEFSQSGATYTPFPDPRSHRIRLDDLAKADVRKRLRQIWLDPHSLNPARISARVTRLVADLLARLAKSIESNPKHEPNQPVAQAHQALAATASEASSRVCDPNGPSADQHPGGADASANRGLLWHQRQPEKVAAHAAANPRSAGSCAAGDSRWH